MYLVCKKTAKVYKIGAEKQFRGAVFVELLPVFHKEEVGQWIEKDLVEDVYTCISM
jgi:hypothetical protein